MNITLVRHSTVLIETSTMCILVDPFFGRGALRDLVRFSPASIELDDIPPCQLILCTHPHFDHFHLAPLMQRDSQVPVVVRPEDAAAARKRGAVHVHPLALWQQCQQDNVTVTAVPARHPIVGGCNGYVIETDGKTLYIAGDTIFFSCMSSIAARFPDIDVAFLPVQGNLGYRLSALNAETAMRATGILNPEHVVLIHMGVTHTVVPFLRPTDQHKIYMRRVAESSMSTIVHHLPAGGGFTL
jgi:L-ascorbate metabolism protein UlaG (beta-lactamase superfamily)